jgi:hypothetical protein
MADQPALAHVRFRPRVRLGLEPGIDLIEQRRLALHVALIAEAGTAGYGSEGAAAAKVGIRSAKTIFLQRAAWDN